MRWKQGIEKITRSISETTSAARTNKTRDWKPIFKTVTVAGAIFLGAYGIYHCYIYGRKRRRGNRTEFLPKTNSAPQELNQPELIVSETNQPSPEFQQSDDTVCRGSINPPFPRLQQSDDEVNQELSSSSSGSSSEETNPPSPKSQQSDEEIDRVSSSSKGSDSDELCQVPRVASSSSESSADEVSRVSSSSSGSAADEIGRPSSSSSGSSSDNSLENVKLRDKWPIPRNEDRPSCVPFEKLPPSCAVYYHLTDECGRYLGYGRRPLTDRNDTENNK